jgi:O-antigen ligase
MVFYQRHVVAFRMTRAHNDYLQLLAEGGLLVFIPAALVVVLLGVAVGRRLGEARHDGYEYWVRAGAAVGLLTMGIQETVEFSLQIPANALLFATLAAVAVSPTQAPRKLS